MKTTVLLLLLFLLASLGCLRSAVAQSVSLNKNDPRLNQIQVIGTHNSYHIAPSPSILRSIRLFSADLADSIDYTHRPLVEQLKRLNIRQIELDIYADPDGGLYSNPIGRQLLSESERASELDQSDGSLDQPGMKIVHSPGFDYRTTVPTFVKALQQIRDWSQQNRSHVPVVILVELKDSVPAPSGVTPIPFSKSLLDAVDAEIRSVFEDSQMVTPDQIRKDCETLNKAVRESGWPKLSECCGKVLFALDNGGTIRDRYIEGHPSLSGRAMFASVSIEHPAAAFIKLNDPIADFEKIQNAVKRGLIVRTRADADTVQARTNDRTRLEAALASGAQFISTDYPEPDQRFSTYQVQLDNRAEFRINPLYHAEN